MKNLLLFITLFLFSCRHTNEIPVSSPVKEYKDYKLIQGIAVKISDGDTFRLLPDGRGKSLRIRLLGIDAPEKKQKYGKQSAIFLSRLIYRKHVRVYYKKKDKYGRILGVVFLDSLNVNREMVKQGMAWWYKYSRDRVLDRLEKKARKEKRGMWTDPNNIPPWEWKHRRKEQKRVLSH